MVKWKSERGKRGNGKWKNEKWKYEKFNDCNEELKGPESGG